MISIVLEQTYGIPNPETRGRPVVPSRPLPSTYYSRPVRLHNPDDLEDDAALSKEVRGQYTVKAKPSSSIGFKPVPGQQLTSNPLK